MITTILANSVPNVALAAKSFIPLIMGIVIYTFIFGLIIIGLLRLVKYLGTAGKEQKLMRMELSKLADELERMRKKNEAEGTESG